MAMYLGNKKVALTKKVVEYAPTGTMNKYKTENTTAYISRVTTPWDKTFPFTTRCIYSEDNGVELEIVYNDWSKRKITTSDVFVINYKLPDNLVAKTSGRVNRIEKIYEFKNSFSEDNHTYSNVWVRTIKIYFNDTELTSGLDKYFGFCYSLSSTSTITVTYAVDNWTLKLNGELQNNVFGIKVIGNRADYFDWYTTTGSYSPSNVKIDSLAICKSTDNYKYYENEFESAYYILNGIITSSSSSYQIISNYPLQKITTKQFNDDI